MRITNLTITCDICGKEIKPELDSAIALLDIKKIVSKINMIQQPSNGMLKEFPKMHTDKELINNKIDICEKCLEKVEKYIETIKTK